MLRISSKTTFFYKRIYPLSWFGLLGFFVVDSLFISPIKGGPDVPFLIVAVLMAVLSYLIMKKLVFDLVDEVWDAGDALIVKNKNQEERIPLAEIMNVSYCTLASPPRVTLTLRHPCRFGKEVSFSPPGGFLPFSKNAIINELVERVDAARRS